MEILFATYNLSNVNIALKVKRNFQLILPFQFVKCHKFTHTWWSMRIKCKRTGLCAKNKIEKASFVE